MAEISLKEALEDGSRAVQIHRDAYKNAARVEELGAALAETCAIAEEALRRLGLFEDREEAKEIARLRAELAEARAERDAALRLAAERPAISREDAALVGVEDIYDLGDGDIAYRVIEALRAHAASVSPPSAPAQDGGENG